MYRQPRAGSGWMVCKTSVASQQQPLVDPALGGGAFGGTENSLAALRTRAVENCTWLVFAWGGWTGSHPSMIIAPTGETVAEENRPGQLAIADIDPFGGREGGDWCNWQDDLRARLFRERQPATYEALTAEKPAGMAELAELNPGPAARIQEIARRATTVGHGQWRQAKKLLDAGKTEEARAALQQLQADYPATWFDREARKLLAENPMP